MPDFSPDKKRDSSPLPDSTQSQSPTPLADNVGFTNEPVNSNTTALVASYTDLLQGGPTRTYFQGFDAETTNCFDGHRLIDERDVVKATQVALKAAYDSGFEEVRILAPEWYATQLGGIGDPFEFFDFVDQHAELKALNDRQLEEHPIARTFVSQDALEVFKEQLRGVERFCSLDKDPDKAFNISFQIEYGEVEATYRKVLEGNIRRGLGTD